MDIRVGVDIGGTSIKMGIFDENYTLTEKIQFDTDLSDGGIRIIPSIAEQIQDYLKAHELTEQNLLGIGMGIPGPVDANGYVERCVNLHWADFDPIKEMKRFFPNCRIGAGNDANVAALGEYWQGSGKGSGSMMLVTLGTGVGGGIILDGKILLGSHGLGGEIGHITVNEREPKACNCGNHGCLDQYASATGLVNMALRLIRQYEETPTVLEPETMTSKDIVNAAREGDSIAMKTLDICMGYLGKAMSVFSHSFDPETYVIGGGVSAAGDIVLDIVRRHYAEHMFLTKQGARIELATLGNDAGMIGACMLIKGE